jgi:uncharacterized membrane protein YkoI
VRLNKRILGSVIVGVLVLGSLGVGIVMAQQNTADTPPAVVRDEDGPDQEYEGLNEADEAAALQGMATISTDEAKAAAEAANPGASVVRVELDNENGAPVYSVEMSNGLEAKVDAGNGQVVHIEQGGDTDQETVDADDVQEEAESQPDDALEVPHAEDAWGQ